MDDVQQDQNPLWAQATRTLRAGASDTELKQLALRHNRESLRQYFVLRVGAEEQARALLTELAAEVMQWELAQLTAAPGPRAQLFARARQLLVERGVSLTPSRSSVVPLQHGAEAAQNIQKLGEHGEVLELAHARELLPVEIAHVLAVGVEEAQSRIQQAVAEASRALSVGDDFSLKFATARTFAATQDAELVAYEGVDQPLGEGDVIGERYEVVKAVGGGAFGQVYLASDMFVPGHRVALKLLHQPAANEQERQTALRELRLIASVFHPSVVSFKDHGWHQGRLWFVMPWYDGESLEDRMVREPLSREEALRIFTPLANALASMHAAGVRHQDIKPENVLLAELATDPLGDEVRHPVLLDLGVAATESDSIIAGTPAYFAPEVAAHCVGEGDPPPVSDKSDVFSLALSLRNALEPDTQEEVQGSAVHLFIAFRAQQPPPPPSGKGLQYLKPHFERWLALDPEMRPTAAQFAKELSVLVEPERKAQRRSAFLGWFVPMAAAFAVLMAGGAFAWSQQMRHQETRAHAAEMKAQNAKLEAAREARLRTQLQQVHGELQQEHQATSQVRDELAAELADTEKQARVLSSRASRLARSRKSTLDELQQRESELGELTAQADLLSQTKEQLEANLTQREGRIRELLVQANELEQLLSETQGLLEREQKRAVDLAAKLDASEEQAARLEKQRDDARDQSSDRKKKLDETRAELEKLNQKLDAQTKQNEKLKKDKQQLQARVEKLETGAKK